MDSVSLLRNKGGYDVILDKLLVQWLATESRPKALINDQLRLIWANESLRRFIDDCPWLELCDDILSARLAKHHTQLVDCISDVVCSETVHVLADPQVPGVVIRAQLVEAFPQRAIGLTLVDCARDTDDRTALAQRLFKLTSAETSVLSNLAKGQTVEQIAYERGRGVSTVRSQIRSLYEKLGVQSREALLAALARFGRA